MSVVNMDKWVSGEVETFFAPQAPTAPVADRNHDEETSIVQSTSRRSAIGYPCQ